jgi:hypothetical protein
VKRIVLAGVVGGLIVLVWGVVSHMVLPLGNIGFESLPNDEPVIAALKGSVPESGLYFFPGFPSHRDATKEQEEAFMARLRQGPSGIVVYTAEGREPMSPAQLLNEFVTSAVAALIAAWVLASVAGGYGKRVLLVALLGLFGVASILLSYWNWYGFPTDYTLANGFGEVVGWLLAGLAMAKIVPAPR